MPVLEYDEVVKLFHEEEKDNYPDINFEKFEEMCKTPFRFAKDNVESMEMPTIELVNLGKLTVYSGRFRTLLKENDNDFRIGKITSEKHAQIDNFYRNRLTLIQEHETGVKEAIAERKANPKPKRVPREIEVIDDTEDEEVVEEEKEQERLKEIWPTEEEQEDGGEDNEDEK